MNRQKGFTTRSLHTPFSVKDAHNALLMPVYDSVAYEFDSAQDMELAFTGKKPGHIYSRTSNPTVQYFEEKIKALTGSFGTVALASGMAAISNAILALTENGDNIISSNHLFGHTYALFKTTLPAWGIEVRLVDINSPEAVRNAIDDKTRAIFFETITNPQLEITNIPEVVNLAKEHGKTVIADTTMTPPYIFGSKKHGVDIEVLSATKFISGGATAFGGVIIDNGTLKPGSIPSLKKWTEKFGRGAFIAKVRKEIFRHLGASMTAQTAHYLNLGLDTLALRIDRSVSNSHRMAGFLKTHTSVKSVTYAGLKDHPQHQLSQHLFGGKPGAVITFDLKDRRACFDLLDNLRLIRRATNLNDNKSLIIHPWSTIYSEFPEKEKEEMQIRDTMLRLSVGIEDADDLIDDIETALKRI